MPTPDDLNQKAEEHIAGLARTVKQLWAKMCREAGIPEDSSFVDVEVFKGSRYLRCYDRALRRLMEARRQRAAGGYAGLRIDGSKVI